MRKTAILKLLQVLVFSLLSCSVLAQHETADSLKRILAVTNDSNRIPLLLELCNAYMKFSPKKALDPAAEARMLAIQAGNETQEAQSLYSLGKVHYKTGNYKEAISCLDAASKLFLQLGKEKQYAEVLITTSNTYLDKGDLNYALTKSLEAYKAAEKIGDKRGMAKALITSGNVYRGMQSYNKAISDYERSIALCREINDAQDEAACLNNIANVYGEKGDNEKAIDYFQRAQTVYERLGDKYSLAKVINNIGTVYMETKRYDDASAYFLRALDIRKEIGDKRGQATALGNLGALSLEQNNPDKAIDYLGRALDVAKNVGATDVLIALYEYMADAYSRKKDYEKALEFFRKEAELKDSVFNENLSESIAEMQARYDVEKAESDTRAQQEQKKIITFSAAGGGVLLLVILVILWNRSVMRKRVNTRLSQQKLEIEQKNEELHEANREIELKNKDITDSIVYARKIQEAILPEVEFAHTFGDKGFVLYRPKDIVSGDFYWMAQTPEHLLFAAVDCTGHGVPGAFVSIVCSNLLSQAVKEHGLVHPEEILNDVNARLSETLRQRQDESRVRDGMDLALCCIHRKTRKLEFAGAFNPAWIFSGNVSCELAPDKFPVGHFLEEEHRDFTRKEFQLKPGDRIYVFSDGYSDQFGGPNGKKYKRSTFLEFVSRIQDQPFHLHKQLLEKEHLDWKGTNEQIDDILVMGVEV